MLQSIAAWLFVIIWSSGFVVARGITDLIDPYLFLLVRFSCVTAIFALAMVLLRTPIPGRTQVWQLMISGAFMQGLYLGPGFWAVSQGLEAGVMALMGSMQPPITAIFAWYLFKERVTRLAILGLCIGLIGVTMAIAPDLLSDSASTSEITPENNIAFQWVLLAAVLSIGAITTGTLLQKTSIVSVPLLSSVTFQTLGAVLVMLMMAAVFAKPVFPATAQAAGYLIWAVFVLSIGGFTLLTWLVRSGSATRASSLLFIVPPLAALLSWTLYGEALGAWQIAGFFVALAGVILARRQPPPQAS
ncbi:MAG: DMT family transporter [Granulosicoccus sp.]